MAWYRFEAGGFAAMIDRAQEAAELIADGRVRFVVNRPQSAAQVFDRPMHGHSTTAIAGYWNVPC